MVDQNLDPHNIENVFLMTRVIHVRKETFDIYIGRACAEFEESKWQNPFHIGKDGNRHEVLRKYYFDYLLKRPDLLEAVSELRGKTLGCWCAPKDCHGHILAALADNIALSEYIVDWESFKRKYKITDGGLDSITNFL